MSGGKDGCEKNRIGSNYSAVVRASHSSDGVDSSENGNEEKSVQDSATVASQRHEIAAVPRNLRTTRQTFRTEYMCSDNCKGPTSDPGGDCSLVAQKVKQLVEQLQNTLNGSDENPSTADLKDSLLPLMRHSENAIKMHENISALKDEIVSLKEQLYVEQVKNTELLQENLRLEQQLTAVNEDYGEFLVKCGAGISRLTLTNDAPVNPPKIVAGVASGSDQRSGFASKTRSSDMRKEDWKLPRENEQSRAEATQNYDISFDKSLAGEVVNDSFETQLSCSSEPFNPNPLSAVCDGPPSHENSSNAQPLASGSDDKPKSENPQKVGDSHNVSVPQVKVKCDIVVEGLPLENSDCISPDPPVISPAPQTAAEVQPRLETIPWPCDHYKRRCLVKFACCDFWYPCHRCHNNDSRCKMTKSKSKDATLLKCLACDAVQPFTQQSQNCVNCGIKFADYFCDICQHLTGTEEFPYHCEKCGICRVRGHRSFHCDPCGVCLDIQLLENHPCRIGSAHESCVVCYEDAFFGCLVLPCSHRSHRNCVSQLLASGIYCCPKCRQSFAEKVVIQRGTRSAVRA